MRASLKGVDGRLLGRRHPPGSADSVIVVEGLEKSFGEVTALDAIDLSVAPGTVVSLLGPNGAGKTTLVRILATVLHPDAGSARILGFDVVRQAAALRPHIGLAGQYAAVDEALTARENLRLIGELSHRSGALIGTRVDGLIERFGLGGNDRRPVRTFSGGVRRRLDLAAALVHNPAVLFLDEPTTGLDPSGRAELWAVIRELVSQGTTTLLTTQYLEEADRLSDNVVVIDHGKIIAQGTPQELKSTLGSVILRVSLSEPVNARAAATLLDHVGMTSVIDGGDTVEVRLSDKGPQVLDAVRALEANRLTPVSLDIRQPTLDDVFLQLTSGPRNADADDPGGSRQAVEA